MERDDEVWSDIPDEDLWIYDKLILSKRLGYVCGPVGMDVPTPGFYCVRPCVNLLGMGVGSTIRYIVEDTDMYPAGYFWQERFEGRHLSIDYKDGEQVLCVEGFRHDSANLTKFSKWVKVDITPTLPSLVQDIVNRYPTVNVETIAGKVIEVHLRGNPDFEDGAIECLPVWEGSIISPPEGYTYVEAKDYKRLGFYKKY